MVFQFWGIFILLVAAVTLCDRKFHMLRDISKASTLPYSWSRVQLAWWTVIILSAFTTILLRSGMAPNLHSSTLVLLGISVATTATARVIDLGDQQNAQIFRHQNLKSNNFFLDILSDHNGVSIQRFQAVLFNAVFGIWFIAAVQGNITDPSFCLSTFSKSDPLLAQCLLHPADFFMPIVTDNNLILLGLSSATYAALKIAENKGTDSDAMPEKISDEALNTPAQG